MRGPSPRKSRWLCPQLVITRLTHVMPTGCSVPCTLACPARSFAVLIIRKSYSSGDLSICNPYPRILLLSGATHKSAPFQISACDCYPSSSPSSPGSAPSGLQLPLCDTVPGPVSAPLASSGCTRCTNTGVSDLTMSSIALYHPLPSNESKWVRSPPTFCKCLNQAPIPRPLYTNHKLG